MNINIALEDLDLSPLNVRKTPPTAEEQAELAASISAHGLLENLIVRPLENDSAIGTCRYEVLAGGRRLQALQHLARNNEIGTDHPVACLVHDGDPGEVSLAENVVRLAMHPLDQFEAFVALTDQGSSDSEIASRFGCTATHVRQRLRLGRVAPAIREAYRAGKIDLDTLMAFAISEDNGQQLAVWEKIRDGYIHARLVRNFLTDGKIAANSKLVCFIGMEAYEAAGGTSMRDLFCEDDDAIYLDNRALVMDLVQKQLSAFAQALQTEEGWKWTQVYPDMPYDDVHKCRKVYPQDIEPTPEQKAELDRLDKSMSFYETVHSETGLSPEEIEKVSELEEQSEILQTSLKVYDPEDMARAGCIIAINHDGSLQIQRGLVLPEDQQAGPDTPAREPAKCSAKLLEELGNTRLEIAQKHLAQDFDCAFDMLLFTMAHSVLKAGYLSDKPLDTSFSTTLPHDWSDRPDTTGVQLPADIDIGWLELDPVAGFAKLSDMAMEDKQRLFACCTALTMQGRLEGTDDLHEAIGCRLKIDTAAHWRPNGDNYFKRITRARALEIAAEVLGEEWARNHSGEKKTVLADALEANFNGKRTPGVTPEQAAVAARWLPDGMAYPVNHDQPVFEKTIPETDELPIIFMTVGDEQTGS